jgi:hypothetical protein
LKEPKKLTPDQLNQVKNELRLERKKEVRQAIVFLLLGFLFGAYPELH